MRPDQTGTTGTGTGTTGTGTTGTRQGPEVSGTFAVCEVVSGLARAAARRKHGFYKPQQSGPMDGANRAAALSAPTWHISSVNSAIWNWSAVWQTCRQSWKLRKGKCSKANFDAILRRSKAYATQGESDKANSKAILGQSEAIKAHNKSDNKSNKSKRQQIKQIKQIKRRTPAASIRGDLTLAK